MKKSLIFKKITAILLVIAMLLSLAACSASKSDEEPSTGENEENASIVTYTDTTENVKKSETVYVNMKSDGSARSIIVSDWLHADRGEVKVADKTTLKDFSVTKGQAASTGSNDGLTWHMTDSDVYYEGSSDKQLPVEISIKYYLDNKEMTAEEMAGQSGHFKMEVTMKNNISKEVDINGQKVKMYSPFIAIGGMILNYENFSNIEVTNGMSIGGGSYEVVVLAGAPGLNESLNLGNLDISGFEDFSFPDTFTVSATVTDFKLDDTYYIVSPLSALDLNIDLPKTLEDVRGVLGEIQDLQEILSKIDPNNVLTDFVTDGTSLGEMMEVMQKAVSVYDENAALLEAMAQYLTPENIQTLTDFINSLNSEQMQSVISLLSNVPALGSLLDSLLQLSTGLGDVMPIIEGMSEALKDPEVAAALENLPETLETLDELMNYLNDNKEVLNVLTSILSSEDMTELTDIMDDMLESGKSASGGSDVSQLTGDAEELVMRMDEWLKFDYSIYTAAPDYMATSCMFICKTDPVSPAE